MQEIRPLGAIVDSFLETMKLSERRGHVLSTNSADCNQHGPFVQSVMEDGFGGTMLSICPKCEQEIRNKRAKEIEAREEADRKEQEQRAHESMMRHFKDMNMEPAYYNASLEDFETPTDELRHNRDRVSDLVEGKIKKIVMTGKNGTGKTHLACAALHILDGRIMSMYEISTTIRASYAAYSNRSELDIVDGLARLPLLVIDEIGRTKGSDVEANWLSYIIDKRHVRDLPLILITNKHVRKTCDKGGCSDCLENYIGEDIMSRLVEDGVLLKFSGEDWRRRR